MPRELLDGGGVFDANGERPRARVASAEEVVRT